MKLLKKHLLVLAVILLYLLICQLFGGACPISTIIGFPCPTCGMTRAMLSLLRADFVGYLEYHPMAFPMILAVLLYIHKNVLGNKKWITWFMGIALTLTMVVYIIRLVQ